MDPEDRPTGCLLCPKHGDIHIDYKVTSDDIPISQLMYTLKKSSLFCYYIE